MRLQTRPASRGSRDFQGDNGSWDFPQEINYRESLRRCAWRRLWRMSWSRSVRASLKA
jgi:hypothetical protein